MDLVSINFNFETLIPQVIRIFFFKLSQIKILRSDQSGTVETDYFLQYCPGTFLLICRVSTL